MLLRKGYLIFLFSCFAALKSIGQDSLNVQWTAASKKVSANQYEIQLRGTVKPGWHVYAKDKQVEGLDGLMISFTNPSIQKEGNTQVSGNTKTIADKIFEDKQLEIVADSITVKQQIKFSEEVPENA